MKSFSDYVSKDARVDEMRRGGKRFEDSSEATDFMYKIQKMLEDPRFVEWCESTDDNFGTRAKQALNQAQTAYKKLLSILESAE